MIVRDALRALGIGAMNDPAPGPGVAAGLSYGGGTRLGNIWMVPALGKQRSATYLNIYRANPFVFAAANYVARGIGRLPIHTYQLDSNADKQRIRSDIPSAGRTSAAQQLDRIMTHPVYPSKEAAYGRMMRERMIFGYAVWEVLSDGSMPYGLKPIPATSISHIEPDGDGGVAWYEIRKERGKRVVLGPNAIHFGLGHDLDDDFGVSILESCHHTLALHEAVMRHLLAYLGNSARPSGMFEAESAKAAREARQLISELYTSPENAGKVLVTNAKWQSMSDSPDHAQLVDLIKESRIEIAASFQVPPPILGLLEQAIRANVTEMRSQFIRETIGPWTSETEGEFRGQLLPRVPAWSSLFVEFQLAEMLRPDLEARALVYQRMMPYYSIDEVRKIENMPPLKIRGVTDVPWVQSGAMPLTTAAKGKQASVPPSDPSAMTLEQTQEMLAITEAFDRANGNGHLKPKEFSP
jgi:HK97 family phage portal protein